MAEFLLRDMVKKAGREADFEIASAGVSYEEQGNPVYPPVRRLLASHGISCEGKYARRITAADYEDYDLIVGMDEENLIRSVRFFGGDPDGKIHNLLDFAGRIGEEIPDPWYTRDFDSAWEDISVGCLCLLNALNGSRPVVLDFSACTCREDLYSVMRERMLWRDDYGSNLDALHDILTGLPYYGSVFRIISPADSGLCDYVGRISDTFSSAGIPVTVE